MGSAGWSDCTSPKTYYDLPEGNHSFSLRAIDSVGNVGPSVYYNWTTDYTDPIVVITSKPASLTNLSSATFEFVSNEYNSTFECKLEDNSSSWSNCSTPVNYNGLNESSHTFYVRTTDEAGNLGNTAVYSWLTDYTDPTVTFTEYPSERTNEYLLTFNFTVDETASFECWFDEGNWFDCNYLPVNYYNLSEGSYLFKVRATDNANNTGRAVDYQWTIDRTNPITTIDSGPTYDNGTYYTSNVATFSFSNNENEYNHTDECSIDETSWSFCTSSVIYNNLSEGNHTFRVRTTDEAGNLGDAVHWNWTVDTEAPVIVQIEITPQIAYYNISVIDFTAITYDHIGYIQSSHWQVSLGNDTGNDTILEKYTQVGGDWIEINWTHSPEDLVLPKGNYTVILSLKDNSGQWSEEVTTWLDIRSGTPIATIESLNNTLVNEHDNIEFAGSGEDVDGVIVQYEWESSLDGLLSDYQSFATNTLSVGEHVISFRVMDNDGQWSSPDQMVVTINAYPIIQNVFWEIDNINRNDFTYLQIEVYDNEDGSNLTDISIIVEYFDFMDIPAWITCECYYNESSNNYYFSPDESFGMRVYDFRVIAIDSNLASTYYYYNQSLFVNNNPPVIIDIDYPEYVNEGEILEIFTESLDDRKVERHEWFSDLQGLIGDPGTMNSTLITDSLTPGIHLITYRVMDDEGAWAEESFEVRVNTEPYVYDLLLNNYLIMEDEFIDAEAMADDDFGIAGYEWSLDGEVLNSLYSYDSDDSQFTSGEVTQEDYYLYVNQLFDIDNEWAFMVNKGAFPGAEDPRDLDGSKICLPLGSIYEQYVATLFSSNVLEYTAVNSYDVASAYYNFATEQCDVWFGELSDLEANANVTYNGNDVEIFYSSLAPQSYVQTVNAEYDQYPGMKTNMQTVFVGNYTLGDSNLEGLVTFDSIDISWRGAPDDQNYDIDCGWTFVIYHNYKVVSENTANCQSNGFVLRTENYLLNHSIISNEGDVIGIEIFYEGWEDVDIYLGSGDTQIHLSVSEDFTEIDNPSGCLNCFPSSWESQNGDMTRTREWVEIGSWYSNTLMEDINLQDKSFQLHIFWSETEEGREDSYDAQVQYRFRVYVDGQEVAYYTDGNNGTNHECAESEPCEWIGNIGHLNLTEIPQGSTIELVIEYRAFSDIEIHALDVDFDSALSFGFNDFVIPVESSLPTLHLEDLSIGVHNISVRVIDSDGVWSEPYSVEFRVNGYPTAVIESVEATVFIEQYNVEDNPRYTEVNLIGNGNDDIGIAACEWEAEYQDPIIFGIEAPDYNWPIEDGSCSLLGLRDFVAGNYTFSLRVMDTDGIWSDWIYHPAIYVDDGDAYDYTVDVFPFDNSQWFDRDQDGCGDNNWDAFPDDPTECLDTDGDGIGDNSDRFPTINNTFLYGGTAVTAALIGAALAELGARRSIPGLINALEQLNNAGISDSEINQAISNLENAEGFQFFSEDRSNALELLNNYETMTGGAIDSMEQLTELQDLVSELEELGVNSPELEAEIEDIESMISEQLEGDTNKDYSDSLWDQIRRKD